MKTAVEWFYDEIKHIIPNDFLDVYETARVKEQQEKIEFACKVAEASAEKYIQGKTTRMIAEELLTEQQEQ
jgi:hypothetical protein